MSAETSRRIYERALASVPTGTHSNSRVAQPHPTYFARAAGAYLWDVDGGRWTDFVMGNGAVILGHGDPHVHEAVQAALATGLGAGVESELSIAVAEKFLQLVPMCERVRFTNTGTEAVMHAVHVARAVTGRPGIAKIEAAYHGWWDDVFISTWPDLQRAGPRNAPRPLPGAPGLRPDAVASAVVIPFNDLGAARSILRQRAEEIAALVLEPALIDIGFVPPEPGYLQGLREITSELGILLVFDELLTGFRVAPGGAQQAYGVTPDLSVWGKALANGFPISALAGSAEMMERTAPGPGNATFVGTFNGYQPALAACLATLERLEDGVVVRELQRRSEAFAAAFDGAAAEAGVPARMHAGGGHFQPYFTGEHVIDYRSAATTDAAAYARWRTTLESRGLIPASKPLLHAAFSAAHADADLEALLDASRAAFAEMAR
jgi:glutamate-1-semialdehyde 2,1-aminomutase